MNQDYVWEELITTLTPNQRDISRIQVIHQNVGNDPAIKKTVQRGSIDMSDVQSGIMWVYRPTQ